MKLLPGIVALLCVGALVGCVEREMEITSEPEGALVMVSHVEVGRTPVKLPFTWYGDYDIILRHDGYETLKTHANLTPPIYEWPPLDLLSAMAPWTYHDRRYLHFTLDPEVQPTDKELIDRAEAMERRNLQNVPR